jgi:hypothetical protein
LGAVDEVVVDVEGVFAGAALAAGFECRQISSEANVFDFSLLAGFARTLCCVAPCGASRPARQPIP